jgi:AcrR family transcriptional regulator
MSRKIGRKKALTRNHHSSTDRPHSKMSMLRTTADTRAIEAPSRRERNKRDKRERIVRAARRLFGRKGFERTTTREIAEAADIGAGTLFLYAGTKEDLLVAIFREEFARIVEQAFATLPATTLLERVLHVFGGLIAYHDRDPGLARVFVKELPFVEDRRHGVAETMAALLGGIVRLIDEAQARGELRADLSAALLAHNLFALYFAQLQRWLGGDPIAAAKRDEGLRASLELQVAGLMRGSPRARAAGRSHDRVPSVAGRAQTARY